MRAGRATEIGRTESASVGAGAGAGARKCRERGASITYVELIAGRFVRRAAARGKALVAEERAEVRNASSGERARKNGLSRLSEQDAEDSQVFLRVERRLEAGGSASGRGVSQDPGRWGSALEGVNYHVQR